MKHWILAAATLLLVQGAEARERRGPPSVCPEPKVDCCEKEKPKCAPQRPFEKPKCAPEKRCVPRAKVKPCQPKPDPCCPSVCFEKGFPTDPSCTPSAYSEAAAIELRCGWDLLFTMNFIYWDVQQDAMTLAIPYQATVTGSTVSGASPSAFGESALNQKTQYTPGFQLGLGWTGAKDSWSLYAQYTWLHGSTSTSADAPAPDATTLGGIAVPTKGVWECLPWHNIASIGGPIFWSTHLSSKWKYKIDLLDAQMSRPFYSGTHFVLEPFFGVRGTWIRQQLNITTTNLVTAGGINGASVETQHNSHAIGIGPRAGLNGDWHFGYGLRFTGNTALSLIYTSFDVRRNAPSSAIGFLPEIVSMNDYHALRPNLDMSLGLGWGSYFSCRRVHFDVAATYDFNIFWGQNMMSYLATEMLFSNTTAGDLFLQGLTIKTRLDF